MHCHTHNVITGKITKIASRFLLFFRFLNFSLISKKHSPPSFVSPEWCYEPHKLELKLATVSSDAAPSKIISAIRRSSKSFCYLHFGSACAENRAAKANVAGSTVSSPHCRVYTLYQMPADEGTNLQEAQSSFAVHSLVIL